MTMTSAGWRTTAAAMAVAAACAMDSSAAENGPATPALISATRRVVVSSRKN